MERVDRKQESKGSLDSEAEAQWRARHATLDAALVRAIHAPRLEQSFDAAVWRRIQADDERLAAGVGEPRRSADQRLAFWMTVLNWVGGAVASIAAITVVAPAIDAVVNVALVAGGCALVIGTWQLPSLQRLARALF